MQCAIDSQPVKKRRKSDGTLNSFFEPRFADKQLVARSKLLVTKTTTATTKKSNEQTVKSRKVISRPLTSSTSPPSVNLRSDKSIEVEPLPEPRPIFVDPSTLPPMPLPLPDLSEHVDCFRKNAVIDDRRTIFGFGDIARSAVETASPPRKRRLVVTTSSPHAECAKILAGPSSAYTSPARAVTPEINPSPARNPLQPVSPNKSPVDRHARAGTRIAWDSDDEVEARRLNRTASAIMVEEELIRKRKPRQAPSVHEKYTDYMDAFRDESYSPLDYHASESIMNGLRAALHLSPQAYPPVVPKVSKRQAHNPSPPHAKLSQSKQIVSATDPEDVFDESATERSTCTSRHLSQQHDVDLMDLAHISPLQQHVSTKQADDSGFGGASSPFLSRPSGCGRVLAPDSEPSETRSFKQEQEQLRKRTVLPVQLPIVQRITDEYPETDARAADATSHILPDHLLEYPETIRPVYDSETTEASMPAFPNLLIIGPVVARCASNGPPDDLTEGPQSVSKESSASIDQQSLMIPQILAVDSQSALDYNTQDIVAAETEMPDCAYTTRKAVHAQTIESCINSAWFENLLRPDRAVAPVIQQTALTDFFATKPGGPSDTALTRIREEEQKVFRAVRDVTKPTEDRPVLLSDSSLSDVKDGFVEDGETEEEVGEDQLSQSSVTQIVPSSQSQWIGLADWEDVADVAWDDEIPIEAHGTGDRSVVTDEVCDSENEGGEEEIGENIDLKTYEGWVEGTVTAVPTPIKKIRQQKIAHLRTM